MLVRLKTTVAEINGGQNNHSNQRSKKAFPILLPLAIAGWLAKKVSSKKGKRLTCSSY
jgi:hypothetical protein